MLWPQHMRSHKHHTHACASGFYARSTQHQVSFHLRLLVTLLCLSIHPHQTCTTPNRFAPGSSSAAAAVAAGSANNNTRKGQGGGGGGGPPLNVNAAVGAAVTGAGKVAGAVGSIAVAGAKQLLTGLIPKPGGQVGLKGLKERESVGCWTVQGFLGFWANAVALAVKVQQASLLLCAPSLRLGVSSLSLSRALTQAMHSVSATLSHTHSIYNHLNHTHTHQTTGW